MATDISPVFGLTLIALSEWATIMGALIGLGGAAALTTVIWVYNHRHLQQQKEVNSAKLALQLREYWDEAKHGHFADMIERVPLDDVDEEELDLGNYLVMWEEIAILCNDGIIIKRHAYEFFSADLQAIRDNATVYSYLEKEHVGDTYGNLWKMLHDLTKPSDRQSADRQIFSSFSRSPL